MSIRMKTLLIVSVVIGLYAAVDYSIQKLVVFPSFVELEQDEAAKDLQRCAEALENEIKHLDIYCYDWAAWDDSYKFVDDANDEFEESNLGYMTFTDMGLNLMYYCNSAGKVVWGQICNIVDDGEDIEIIQLDEFPADSLPLDSPLLAHEDITSAINGVIMTEQGPMLICSRPITTSEVEGPIRGSLIMGKFLTDDYVERLAGQTNVDFTFKTVQGVTNTGGARKYGDNIHISEVDEQRLLARKSFSDINGSPAFMMTAKVGRDITAKGSAALGYALVSTIVSGVVVLVVLLVSLQINVVNPISYLTETAVAIAKSNGTSARISLERNDEIGTLATEFNNMLEQIEESKEKLSQQSYQSGAAEMASEILESAKSALSPMVSQIEDLKQKFNESHIGHIQQLRQNLEGLDPADRERENLTNFMMQASNSLVETAKDTHEKLDTITEQINQIETVLAKQDDPANT